MSKDYEKEFDDYVMKYHAWTEYISGLTEKDLPRLRRQQRRAAFWRGMRSRVSMFRPLQELCDILLENPAANPLEVPNSSRNIKLTEEQKDIIREGVDWYQVKIKTPTEEQWRKYPPAQIAQGLQYLLDIYNNCKSRYVASFAENENAQSFLPTSTSPTFLNPQ